MRSRDPDPSRPYTVRCPTRFHSWVTRKQCQRSALGAITPTRKETTHLTPTRRATPPDTSDGQIPVPRAASTTPARTGADQEQAIKLADYVRDVAHTAPPPTPVQRERLAGLLRDTQNPT